MKQPEPLGTWLLRRARNHGMTGEQLADLLGLPVHRIRQFATAADLDDLPVRAIRAMASHLGLPWPDWLQPVDTPDDRTDPTSSAPTADSPGDANCVHAVLALALGQPMRLDQIAHILNWPLERTQTATDHLAQRLPGHQSLRLIAGDDRALRLIVPSDILAPAARTRLQQLTYQQQGPMTGMALIAYRAGYRDRQRIRELLIRNPELLEAAVAAGYITCRMDANGQPTAIQLTPEVAFSLNIPIDLHDTLLLDPET
ncbi:hypothetical protein [Nonomuraea sp. B19D2]|uniref:hypothetical protein n=1 Tax=Nonomuraea sp. B19D2 TaxID=3159561 RepID=UPI0032DB9CFD